MSIIKVENLSKKYIIGHDRNAGGGYRYNSLRDSLAHTTRGIYQRLRHPLSPNQENTELEEFWALKDINFEVKQGDRVGIIGRNGAGKSTLLKILSRITEPTTGKITLNGRVASLLEVGTGFHPELSGRENIYLNGAVLGMTRVEIKKKFDEIVDFSGVEKFLDTPVKRYSSGMYVRLAFAVAAHLEPEILLVDEVLAVGDAEFQKKCLGKMEDVSKEGRTVIFISHNMGMIISLCSDAILLNSGKIAYKGTANDAVSHYYNNGATSPFSVDYREDGREVGDKFASLLEAHIENSQGEHVGAIDIRSPFMVVMSYKVHSSVSAAPCPHFNFFTSRGEFAFTTGGRNLKANSAGEYKAICSIPGSLLNNDTYFIAVGLTFLHNGEHVSFSETGALCVNIIDPIDETVNEIRCGYSGHIPGSVRPILDWQIERI